MINKTSVLVEAVCESIGAGDHTVKIRTTQCNVHDDTGNYYTGWKSYSRIHIEEVRQSTRLDAGRFQNYAYISCYNLLSSSKYSRFLNFT